VNHDGNPKIAPWPGRRHQPAESLRIDPAGTGGGLESEEDPSPKTRFLRDQSQSIISYNDSPDLSFKPV